MADIVCGPDNFDEGTVKFDNGKNPPGWAQRSGFAIRITSREEARENAIIAFILKCLQHPIYIWARDKCTLVPLRDSYMELNRAYPPFKKEYKQMFCLAQQKFIPQVLETLARKYNPSRVHDEDSELLFVLHCSQKHIEWDSDTCEYCKRPRSPVDQLVLMRNCEHVLCLHSRCLKNQSDECPICANADIFDSEHHFPSIDIIECDDPLNITSSLDLLSISPPIPSHCESSPQIPRVVPVDYTLHISKNIINRCLKKMHGDENS